MIETATTALRSRRTLELRYEDYVRVVEVHAVGWTKAGHSVMRVWQVRGGGGGGRNERPGWKLLKISEANEVVMTNDFADVPRRGYRRSDAALDRIICEL